MLNQQSPHKSVKQVLASQSVCCSACQQIRFMVRPFYFHSLHQLGALRQKVNERNSDWKDISITLICRAHILDSMLPSTWCPAQGKKIKSTQTKNWKGTAVDSIWVAMLPQHPTLACCCECIYVYFNMYIHIYRYIYTYIQIYIFMCKCVYMHVYIYMYL